MMTRFSKISSVDLKKLSPYLSRNEVLKKAQQVLEYEHKFRMAQEDYQAQVKSTSCVIIHKQGKLNDSNSINFVAEQIACPKSHLQQVH